MVTVPDTFVLDPKLYWLAHVEEKIVLALRPVADRHVVAQHVRGNRKAKLTVSLALPNCGA